nr:hypothetical protein [Tanacetum cinerariifolium]
MCEMACQIVQKKQEEKKIKEEQAAKAQNSKIPACCDDDDDYNSAITLNEPVDSLNIRDEHLNTILATESDEFIKSSDYESDSSDYQSCSDEDFPEEIFSNPLFEEEIISTKIDPHHFDAESDLIESILNRDSSIISSSSKIDSLLDEFTSELALLKSIPPKIDETDCHPKNEIRFCKILLYDNSSPRPSEEFVYENSDVEIESFSPYPIPNEDSDSRMEEIDLSFNPDDLLPPGIEDNDDDSERDVIILEELLENYSLSLSDWGAGVHGDGGYGEGLVQAKNFQWGLRKSTLNHLMCMPFTDVAQVANAARNYEIHHERDDEDTERPDKRRVVIDISRPLNRVVTGTMVIIMTVMDQTGEAVVTTTAAATTTLAITTEISVIDVARETGVSSPTDLSILVPSSPGVPLRATPTRFALRVDADTQESVVELLVPASSVVKLAICRRIARRTPLRVHLVRLIRI